MTLTPHHYGISVKDLEASIAWYGTHFGFQERSRFVTEDGNLKIAYISNGSFEIEVFEQKNSTETPKIDQEVGSSFSVRGYKHFAFQVDDVDAYWEHLSQNGHDLVTPPTTNADLGVRYCFIRDIDGILLEFLTRTSD